MNKKSIFYYNRYTKKIEEEIIYAEHFLRWAYQGFLGPIVTWGIIKRHYFSKFYGKLMSLSVSRKLIPSFIKKYNIDISEFSKNYNQYKTFNDFFIRKLKLSNRPITLNSKEIIFPSDGRHLGFEDCSKIKTLFIKGKHFKLSYLLGSTTLSKQFKNGTLIFSRLCPTDYHRFHFPVNGTANVPFLINGCLYSVNPIALTRYFKIFWENQRWITKVETKNLGTVLSIEIGATCVGSLHYNFQSKRKINKGQEKGYFSFGGSSIITLFEPGKVKLAKDLLKYSSIGIEMYAHMGDYCGNSLSY